jgi:Tfp pilus assembly protein PilN
MSGADRRFGALLAHDGITLVEYQDERAGVRIAGHWTDTARSASIDEALSRLSSLVNATGAKRAHLSLAIEQFGAVHHVMTVPAAPDEILRPIVMRELQRVFGLMDPVVAFAPGVAQERRQPSRADTKTAPRQLFVAGAPADMIDAVARQLQSKQISVDIVTVVPKTMHSLYEATGAPLEPTAVLVCLESGPHLAFFLDGRLELAIDPPIALEGERPTVPMILDQVERGAVYFRQQFRGATATRVLLAARSDEYDAIAAALEGRLSASVKPLFSGAASPEAVVAMGAVLEGRRARPLDLYPHPPTIAERAAKALSGPNAFVAAGAAVAAIVMLWAASQVTSLSSMRRENEALRDTIRVAIPATASMRQIAERRADVVKQTEFVRNSVAERSAFTTTLTAIGATLPDGVVFDTLNITRSRAGWSSHLGGLARGTSAAEAVRGLQSFLEGLRTREGVSSASLDGFDYATPPSDTTKRDNGVTLRFQISFVLARAGGSQ